MFKKSKPVFGFLLVIAITVSLAFMSCTSTPTTGNKVAGTNQEKFLTPVEKHGRLSVKDRELVDQYGKPVQLRGMSTFNIASYDYLITPETIREFARVWKCDVFRIAMYTDRYQGGYAANPKLREVVDEMVAMCKAEGMYAIIDWHILSDNDPTTKQDLAREFFDIMSKKYANEVNVLYEICNEPNQPYVTWNDKIRPYAVDICGTIRKNDPNGVILVGTPTWSQDVDIAAENPLDFQNLMYVFHFYAGSHGDALKAKILRAHEKVALFCTEWGTSDADVSIGVFPAETRAFHEFLNKNNFSSCNWSISTKREPSSALQPEYYPQDGAMIDNLTESGKLVLEMIRQGRE